MTEITFEIPTWCQCLFQMNSAYLISILNKKRDINHVAKVALIVTCRNKTSRIYGPRTETVATEYPMTRNLT